VPKYYIRTEETPEQAEESLRRGRSVRRWAFAGNPLRTMLRYDLEDEEQYDAVRLVSELFGEPFPEQATEDDLREALDVLDDILEPGSPEEAQAAAVIGYERFGNGWARYLDGLCALREYDYVPQPEEITKALNRRGDLFRYLVCYEGEYVGWDDADEGWPLFRPIRIVWIHDRGVDAPRAERIRYG